MTVKAKQIVYWFIPVITLPANLGDQIQKQNKGVHL